MDRAEMAGPGAGSGIRPRNEPTQLALALDHGESFARDDFLAGPSNAAALQLIERWPDWPSRIVALRGPEGSGKSHLAAIWAREAGARILSPRTLTGGEVPIALATGALAIENLAEHEFDEPALFHLLNLAREERAYVLITTRSAPSGWRVGVPDLASRLRAVPIIALEAPDDALLRAVIVKLFADRQLAVDESLVAYLATRIERSFAAARSAVAALDREALRLKRPVNRALAAELFREP
jgi:chromosomal replication initiation ATPase DnaA